MVTSIAYMAPTFGPFCLTSDETSHIELQLEKCIEYNFF